MKKALLILFVSTFGLAFSQSSDEVEYKYANVQNGIQSGSLDNIKDITKVNIKFDYEGMVISAKSIGGETHYSEEVYLNKKAAKVDEEDKGKGKEFLKSWEEGKMKEYPTAFETLFNKYGKNDINMEGTYNGTDASYNLLVKTTKIEPGYQKGMLKFLPYIDVEFTFSDESGKELLKLYFKSVMPSSAGAPVWSSIFRNIAPSYEKAAKKLVVFIQDSRKGK